MPAPAVIPAPIAYIKVVAVKKLVVEFWGSACLVCREGVYWLASPYSQCWPLLLTEWRFGSGTFTLKKLGCSKQA